MSLTAPKKGELGFLEFTPQSDVEQTDHHPCLVLSPESFNQAIGPSIVCPIRSRSGDWPFEVELPEHLNIKGHIITDQVKSINWEVRRFNVQDEAPREIVQNCLAIIHTFLS